MNDNLKREFLKKIQLNIESTEYYEFNDGTAIIINHSILYWFNSTNDLVFKFTPNMNRGHFPSGNIKNPNIYKVIKVNNWLKVYFVDNMVLHVLADNTGKLTPCGFDLWYYPETWNPLLSEADTNHNILSHNGHSITFKYPIENIQYYDNGFIVLANSHEFPRPESEKYLTLYSISQDCKLRWQMADYTKTDPIPENGAFKLVNGRIDTYKIEEDIVYAAYGTVRLKIDAKTGRTISYSSFASQWDWNSY